MTTESPKQDSLLGWLAIAAAAAALGLRLYHLKFQALWWDEGISLYLASQGLAALTTAKDFALDLHPPLYHVLLAAWTSLVGQDVFSARALSALLGTLNVPLLYLLVRRLAGAGAGLGAAVLLAVSPVHIYYSQEVRMYTFMPLLATLSLLAFVALLRANGRREHVLALVGYVAATAAGLYAYYYIGLLVIVQNLFFAARWLARRRDLRWWVAAQLATLLLFVPWLLVLVALFTQTDLWAVTEQAVPAGEVLAFLRTFGLAFTVGFSIIDPWSSRFAVLFGILGLAGLTAGGRRGWEGRALVLLWLVLPVALTYAIGVERAFVFPRFVLFSALAVYALVGAGTALLWRRLPLAGVAAGALLLASSALGLSHQYATPRTAYASSDYLLLLQRLGEMARPGDAVLADQAWGAGYARGYLPEPLPALVWAPPAWGKDASLANANLQDLLRQHGRVWLLRWCESAPCQPGYLEAGLGRAGTSRFIDQYGEFRLQLYAVEGQAGVEPPLGGRGDVFGDAISLSGYETSAGAALAPGGAFDLTLVWEALASPGSDYTVFTQLLGPDGRIYAQKDNPPVSATRPTGSWSAGEVVVDRYRLKVDPAAPAGSHRLIVGWYDPQSGQRLPVGGSDHLLLATVTVQPPAAPERADGGGG